MAYTGMTTKLKLGLIGSVSCAFTYILLVYMFNSWDFASINQSTIQKVIPEKIRNSPLVERISDQVDEYLTEDFRPPPIKSFQPNKINETKEGAVNTKAPETKDEEKNQPTDEDKEAKEPATDIDKTKMTEQPNEETKTKDHIAEGSGTSSHLILHGVSTFPEALAKVASPERVVLLTLVDYAFHAMAINFYLTCVKPFQISNYIILTMHPDTCGVLEAHGINCFFFKDMRKGDTASSWGTQIFKDKMNVRTEFIIQALQADFSVLHTDIDMYCFKNIMESVKCPRESCDIAPLMDTSAYNAGFLFINPSGASLSVYERMAEVARKSPKIDDQAQLNGAMNRQKKLPGGLKIKSLPTNQYFCGLTYYEQPHRYFADTAKPCPDCVVVHNNWIVSMESKVYRAKEMQHWMFDGDSGGYYTDPNAKYLRYQHSLSHDYNLPALKSSLAIAEILNRTLILPAFTTKSNTPAPLNALVRIVQFDKEFHGKYREHSFSTHPLVPESVKSSCSPLYVIASDIVSQKSPEILKEEGVKVITPKDPKHGMSDEEILEHFKDIKESILEMYPPVDGFSSYINPDKQKAWDEKWKRGSKSGSYRQYG